MRAGLARALGPRSGSRPRKRSAGFKRARWLRGNSERQTLITNGPILTARFFKVHTSVFASTSMATPEGHRGIDTCARLLVQSGVSTNAYAEPTDRNECRFAEVSPVGNSCHFCCVGHALDDPEARITAPTLTGAPARSPRRIGVARGSPFPAERARATSGPIAARGHILGQDHAAACDRHG
jgi:hypothetical protein